MKVIKLKQSDVEEIVKQSVINENHWNEETDEIGEINEEDPLADDSGMEPQGPAKTLSMMAGDDGNYYVVDWSNPSDPKVVAQTHK